MKPNITTFINNCISLGMEISINHLETANQISKTLMHIAHDLPENCNADFDAIEDHIEMLNGIVSNRKPHITKMALNHNKLYVSLSNGCELTFDKSDLIIY